MTDLSRGESLAIDMCAILGIEPSTVSHLTVQFSRNNVLKVAVDLYVTKDQEKQAQAAFAQYEFTVKPR